MHTIFTIDEEDVTCGIVTIGSRLMLDVLIRHITGLVQTSGSPVFSARWLNPARNIVIMSAFGWSLAPPPSINRIHAACAVCGTCCCHPALLWYRWV